MKRDKLITHYEAAAALQRLINSRFNQACVWCSIPVSPDDDDVLVSDYLEQMKPVDMTVLANHTKWHALCGGLGLTDPSDTPADTVLDKLNEKQEQYATEKTAGLQRDLKAVQMQVENQSATISSAWKRNSELRGKVDTISSELRVANATIAELMSESTNSRTYKLADKWLQVCRMLGLDPDGWATAVVDKIRSLEQQVVDATNQRDKWYSYAYDTGVPIAEAKTRVIVLTDNSGKTVKEVADAMQEALSK